MELPWNKEMEETDCSMTSHMETFHCLPYNLRTEHRMDTVLTAMGYQHDYSLWSGSPTGIMARYSSRFEQTFFGQDLSQH